MNIILDGQPVEQTRALKHIADARLCASPPAFGWIVDRARRRTNSIPAMTFSRVDFAATRGSDDADEFTLVHGQADVVETVNLSSGARGRKSFRQIFDGDGRGPRACPCAPPI